MFHAPAQALTNDTRRLHEAGHAPDLSALWQGHLNDRFAIATVTGTAGLALYALKAAPTVKEADKLARALWDARHQPESQIA